jgi:hypothetical protein
MDMYLGGVRGDCRATEWRWCCSRGKGSSAEGHGGLDGRVGRPSSGCSCGTGEEGTPQSGHFPLLVVGHDGNTQYYSEGLVW